jgi:hypothetical protein
MKSRWRRFECCFPLRFNNGGPVPRKLLVEAVLESSSLQLGLPGHVLEHVSFVDDQSVPSPRAGSCLAASRTWMIPSAS